LPTTSVSVSTFQTSMTLREHEFRPRPKTRIVSGTRRSH
jgi:hypothetical protein